MVNTIAEAFRDVCRQAELTDKWHYVSLYANYPYYGGPEEGGWWGQDTHLIATERCATLQQAERLLESVRRMAKDLDQQAQRAHGERCLRELEFCASRGIDDSNSVFGEVDGAESYFCVIEDKPGSLEARGDRYYS